MICDAYPDVEDYTKKHHHGNKTKHQGPISLLLFVKAISLNLNQREPQFLDGDHLEKAHNELAVNSSVRKLVSVTKTFILVYVQISYRKA